ncbi:MAG: M15 family metallopeptidase, partial [Pseudomonadota bacterium]
MNRSHVRALQRKLAEMGHYTAAIDGKRGPRTEAAATIAAPELAPVPDDFASWSDKRRTIACLQCYALSEDCDPGVIDGYWGPATDEAVADLMARLAGGDGWHWADVRPIEANPHAFPVESAVTAFYGPPGRKDGSHRPPMEKVPLPWTLKLSWNRNATRSFLWAHEKCAASLKTVLDKVQAAYSDAQKAELGIDLFGGDYAPRTIRRGSRPSLHSWGIAFDFDPERNSMDHGPTTARLAQPDAVPFWEAWESEGWYSLGRAR